MTLPHRAHAQMAAGRHAEAVLTLSDHLSQHPGDAVAWDAAAESLLQLGQHDGAREAAERAWQLSGEIDAACLFAVALGSAGRGAEALAIVQAAIGERPHTPRAWERIARALDSVGLTAAALEARAEAHQLAPDDLGVALRLAERLERADRRDEARALAATLLQAHPEQPQLERLLVRLDHHDGRLDEAAARAERLLASDTLPRPIAQGLWMELARIEARRGHPRSAAAAAHTGNTLALSAWRLDPTHDPDALPRRLDALLAADLGPVPPAPPLRPGMAFVVGFPRSGTTLVQQILEAHPATATFDEAPLLDRAVDAVFGPGADWVEVARRVGDPATAAALRQAWWDQVHQRIDPAGRLVIDKLPLNLLRIDLILRAFPGAPIVVVQRDPRDAVLSAWMQDFELNQAMAQCADLGRCARLYARAFDLWLRVRDAAPSACALRYEDLVADPERALRPVIEALGLTWDDAVLAHATSARAATIRTPSYRDVRQPVYARSVNRWAAFAEALAPVLPTLAPYAAAFGYPPAP